VKRTNTLFALYRKRSKRLFRLKMCKVQDTMRDISAEGIREVRRL
jgi:hypothetical protein